MNAHLHPRCLAVAVITSAPSAVRLAVQPSYSKVSRDFIQHILRHCGTGSSHLRSSAKRLPGRALLSRTSASNASMNDLPVVWARSRSILVSNQVQEDYLVHLVEAAEAEVETIRKIAGLVESQDNTAVLKELSVMIEAAEKKLREVTEPARQGV